MKKILLLTLLSITIMISGCNKINKLTQFEIEYNETAVIESSIGINLPFNIYTPNITTNSASTFAINDTRKDLVEEVILTALDLTLTTPQDADFSFLKSIEVYLSAEDLPEILIAWNDAVPSNTGNYLELETAEADLQEYIKKDQFSLRLQTITGELLLSDHSIDIHAVFFVDAQILGQ
jgi:hypothetical protein